MHCQRGLGGWFIPSSTATAGLLTWRSEGIKNCIQPDVCKTKLDRHVPCGLKKIEAFRMQSMLFQRKPGNERAEKDVVCLGRQNA